MRVLLTLCLFLVAGGPLSGQTAEEKKSTVAYLQSLQLDNGGFRLSSGIKVPSLRATSSALRAIKYFGGQVKNLAACTKFVLSCREAKSGGFADVPAGKPDVVLTAVGLMALVELAASTDRIEKAAISYMTSNAREFEQVRMAAAGLEAIGKKSEKNRAWLADLARKQNADETFGKGKARARDTGGALACLLRLGGSVQSPQTVVKMLDGEQRPDGGFAKEEQEGSDLETTYRVLRTYHMLRSQPRQSEALRKFVARCRNADGGYGLTPGGPSSVGSTYFAGIILHWLDKK